MSFCVSGRIQEEALEKIRSQKEAPKRARVLQQDSMQKIRQNDHILLEKEKLVP